MALTNPQSSEPNAGPAPAPRPVARRRAVQTPATVAPPPAPPPPSPQASAAEWSIVRIDERLARMRAVREFALRVAKDSEESRVSEAALHLASAQLYELLVDFKPQGLQEALAEDPQTYARLINALVKIGDGELKYNQYRAQIAERKAAIEKALALARGGDVLTTDTIEKIERELQLF